MSASTRRILDPSILPVTLWEPSEQLLILPPILASAYEAIIDCHKLRLLAASRNRDNPPVGGLTQHKADEHFAQAFDGSAARTQLALLDPKDVGRRVAVDVLFDFDDRAWKGSRLRGP
jgi:hypothetical protein